MKPSLRSLTLKAGLLGLVAWGACKKSSSDGNSVSPRVALITSSTWRYDTSGIDLNKDGTIDLADTTIPACEKQYTYLFKADSTGLLTGGATKCSPGDPSTMNFTWFLTNNQSVLTASVDPLLSGGINILNVTSTQFILYKDTSVMNIPLRYLVFLKH